MSMTFQAGGYETAPSTVLLAQSCACCGRALRDAASVERGVGPDCAEKYGYGDAQGEACWIAVEAAFAALPGDAFAALSLHWGDAHKMANAAVHYAACVTNAEREPFIGVIAALGYVRLAGAVAKAAGEVVEVLPNADGSRLFVKTPYTPAFNVALKDQRIGAFFDREHKAWSVPVNDRARRGLFVALKHVFAGRVLVSQKGVSRLPERQPAAAQVAL